MNFFTRPLAEPNTIPRTPPDPTEDPRLIEAQRNLSAARRSYIDASFQVAQFNASHRSDLCWRPYVISDGTTVKYFAPVNCQRDEDPRLCLLSNAQREAKRKLDEAQQVHANLKFELGLSR